MNFRRIVFDTLKGLRGYFFQNSGGRMKISLPTLLFVVAFAGTALAQTPSFSEKLPVVRIGGQQHIQGLFDKYGAGRPLSTQDSCETASSEKNASWDLGETLSPGVIAPIGHCGAPQCPFGTINISCYGNTRSELEYSEPCQSEGCNLYVCAFDLQATCCALCQELSCNCKTTSGCKS